MFPSERASRVTWATSRAAKVAGAARLPRFVPGARKPGPSGLGVKRVELVFRQRPVAQSELDRNIVKPARREAAIEMPQPRNDHPHDRGLDVGTGLIEHEEIESCALDQVHAGGDLRARVELAKIRVEVGSDDRSAARRQIGMVPQPKWRGTVMMRVVARFLARFLMRTLARLIRGPAAHESDGQKLIELGHRAERGDARIEVGAGTEIDKFLAVFHPVRDRYEGRNAEIAGDVE